MVFLSNLITATIKGYSGVYLYLVWLITGLVKSFTAVSCFHLTRIRCFVNLARDFKDTSTGYDDS